jgi:large subunit ribosomal protein L21
MDYAIIEIGGKQYRVEKGDSLLVDRLDAKQGAKIAPRALLWRSDGKTVLDGPDLEKVKVEAVVTEHLKGEKIRVFKYRPKKRYRRRAGHRSLLTRLEIKEINGPGGSGEGRKAAAGSSEGPKTAGGSAEGSKAAAGSRKKPTAARTEKGETKGAPAKKGEAAGGSRPKKAPAGKPSAKSNASMEG